MGMNGLLNSYLDYPAGWLLKIIPWREVLDAKKNAFVKKSKEVFIVKNAFLFLGGQVNLEIIFDGSDEK
jgi:hypothetical protein